MATIFYFTSTGNSLYVSKVIKENIENVTLINIANEIKDNIYKDDVIGIIYPLHCFSIPVVVENFLNKLKIEGNPYIFAIQVTGGGSSNNGFIKINSILEEKGLTLNSYEEIKYISNYTRASQNPTKEMAIESIKNEEEKLNKFIEDIKNKEDKNKILKKQIVSNFVYGLWKNKYKRKDRSFNVNNSCVSCALCEKVCPINNITLEDGRPRWNGNCVDCMACINICPKKAINIGKRTVKKNRYRNPYINREELIK